ncbi:MAG TPA: zinc-binding dehydrogenase, partial [Kineosporiaceae bacterium]|nr:zinc-binding dehydrogenase [Kineosporiaceae bacterium]
YTTGSVVEQVRSVYQDGVDALINLVGNTPAEIPLGAVRKDGQVATTTMVADAGMFAAAGLTGATVFAHPVREIIAPLAEQAAAGALSIDVHTVLPLERATEGLATLAAGTASGKIVITIDA